VPLGRVGTNPIVMLIQFSYHYRTRNGQLKIAQYTASTALMIQGWILYPSTASLVVRAAKIRPFSQIDEIEIDDESVMIHSPLLLLLTS